MKTLFLILGLFFSTQHLVAHAQSCVNEHGSPLVQPHAQEVSSAQDFDQIVSPTQTGNAAVLVEFYMSGCCWYNGEVPVINEMTQIYGSSLRVIQVDLASEAGAFSHGGASPQFHLFTGGHEYFQQGVMQGNAMENWINDRTGLAGSVDIANVAPGAATCSN
jgi:hypothetical protein